MRFLFAIVAIIALSATEANAARWYHRGRADAFFARSGGPVARATFRPQPIFGGPTMVWRGDWVPAYMVR